MSDIKVGRKVKLISDTGFGSLNYVFLALEGYTGEAEIVEIDEKRSNPITVKLPSGYLLNISKKDIRE